MFIRKRIDRAAWEAAVLDNPHHRPVSDELLRETTQQIVANDVRIILESVELVMTTRYSDTREYRRALAEQWYAHLISLKPFMDKKQLKLSGTADEAMKKLSLFYACEGWVEDAEDTDGYLEDDDYDKDEFADDDEDEDNDEDEDDDEKEVPITPAQDTALNTVSKQLRSILNQLQGLENEMNGDNAYTISDAASAIEDALSFIEELCEKGD